MKILVDSSIWINYFKAENNDILDLYIDQNLVVIKDLPLAEPFPYLIVKRQIKLNEFLKKIELITVQAKCIKKGINGIETPDLIIAPNVLHENCRFFSSDKHFVFLRNINDRACLVFHE